MKKALTRTISLLLIVIIFISVFLVTSVSAASNSVVTTDTVRLRSSAKITDDNILATLEKSEELTLLKDSSDGWAYVSRKNGTKGYCSIDYLMVPSGSEVTISGVTTDDVYFRKGPSVDYDYIKLLDNGTSFTVTDNTSESWVKAKIGSVTGYIYRAYTTLAVKLPTQSTDESVDNREALDWVGESALDSLLGTTPEVSEAPVLPVLALSDSSLTVEEGQEYTITPYMYIQGASSAVSFRSSNTAVVTVSDNGTVLGKTAGKAVITAYIPGSDIYAECEVVVTESTTLPEEDDLSLSLTTLNVNKGNHSHITANISVKWKSSNTSVITVSDGIVYAKEVGTATVTAYTDTQSKSCTVKVVAASSDIAISKTTATVSVGKTYYNGVSCSESVSWTSSDTSVAKVQNGFITAVSAGKAVITAKSSAGAKTCLVTVNDAEPVRFTYCSPNTAAIGETVTLCAVTDTKRTAVKFELIVGSQKITVNATDKVKDGSTYVWSGTTTVSASGTYTAVAYAKTDGVWQTCTLTPEDAKTTVFIRATKDKSSETMEQRRASDDVISLIASFEGYSSSVYFDTIANNIPTLGYGKVLYIGDCFYNDMTKNEAYAYLVQSVNNDGYTTSVNTYLNKYNINRNQYQFDALISFCYNLGSNVISNDGDFKKIFTATASATGASDEDAYVNASNVNLRSGPSTSYSVVTTLSTGDLLTLVSTQPENGWYQVKTEDGKTGFIYADYVTKGTPSASAEYFLSEINKNDFINLMLQYHHAGANCVWGLLYRRVDELEVFFTGEYTRNGSENKNKYSFTCSVNSSTKL